MGLATLESDGTFHYESDAGAAAVAQESVWISTGSELVKSVEIKRQGKIPRPGRGTSVEGRLRRAPSSFN
eukprot:38923-Amphidinium_carterae.2